MDAAAGGKVDIQSITEASLRIASCSGPVKLGKIKASSADVITEGGIPHCIYVNVSVLLCVYP